MGFARRAGLWMIFVGAGVLVVGRFLTRLEPPSQCTSAIANTLNQSQCARDGELHTLGIIVFIAGFLLIVGGGLIHRMSPRR
jgi:uncharacterized membrane protein